MTYRDPAPTVPSCPLCGRVEGVERQDGGLYLCHGEGGCWTVFNGSTDEWERMKRNRELRAHHYEKETEG